MKLILLVVSMKFSAYSLASPQKLAVNATITKVASTGTGGGDDFYVSVTNNEESCGAIIFPRSLAPSEKYHDRAFAIALLAFSTGNTKVQITGYVDNDRCLNAQQIEIQK